MSAGATDYMQAVREALETIAQTQMEAIHDAATLVVHAVLGDHLVYLFGTGHSHLLAEEGHYRAGGLAAVCPILSPRLMLHEGAVSSTAAERTSGLAPGLLEPYPITADDVIVIFSNSGVNAVPVEVAMAARQKGMKVIAVVALDYASSVQAGPSGRKLHELADVVIDNQGPPGDALIHIDGTSVRTGPISTIAGAFILNAILTEAVAQLAAQGYSPLPIYVSANMPGAPAHNAALVERYRDRNPHL